MILYRVYFEPDKIDDSDRTECERIETPVSCERLRGARLQISFAGRCTMKM